MEFQETAIIINVDPWFPPTHSAHATINTHTQTMNIRDGIGCPHASQENSIMLQYVEFISSAHSH